MAAGVEETGAAGTTGAAGIGTVAAATLDVFCGWAPKPAGAEELGPIIGPTGRDTGGNCCVRGGACWACCRGCCWVGGGGANEGGGCGGRGCCCKCPAGGGL